VLDRLVYGQRQRRRRVVWVAPRELDRRYLALAPRLHPNRSQQRSNAAVSDEFRQAAVDKVSPLLLQIGYLPRTA
jgi:hypothetical protein